MYESFYGLREPPFSITPDPRFLRLGAQHRRALEQLLAGIENGRGILQITGEVGAGKTTLCRTLLERLGPEVETALILNPAMTPSQLLRSVLRELGEEAGEADDRGALLERLRRHLLGCAEAGKRVVLLIDEAQVMSPELLDEVRRLAGLETADRHLLQIVLFGQPELRALLERPELRALRQRITVRHHLAPLERDEIGAYVGHRLGVAGFAGRPSWSDGALREIYRYSGGVPRLVNALCDRTLLCGYVDGVDALRASHVRRAARELEQRPVASTRSWGALALAVLFLVLAGMVVLFSLRESPAPPVVAAPVPAPVVDPAAVVSEETVAGEIAAGDTVAGETPAAARDAASSSAVEPAATAEIEAVLQSWAQAWSDQRIDAYLDHYARGFEPPGGMRRARWAAQRAERLERPDYIRLTLVLLGVEVLEDDRYRVRFEQTYRSDVYSDVVTKTLELVREDGRLKIAREVVE